MTHFRELSTHVGHDDDDVGKIPRNTEPLGHCALARLLGIRRRHVDGQAAGPLLHVARE